MIAGHQNCRDRAQLVSLLGNSEEFRRRQELGYATMLSAVTRFDAQTADPFDFPGYVVPTALSRSPSPISGVLLVGACLLDGWAATIRSISPTTIVDHVLFSSGGHVAAQAPRPIADYDCVALQIPLRMVLPDYELFEGSYGDIHKYEVALDRTITRLDMLFDGEIGQFEGRPVFVMNYPVPQQNPLGRLLPRYDIRNPAFFSNHSTEHWRNGSTRAPTPTSST